jgi:hypothetical protein
MAAARSTLLKPKRPGKDLNDPLFSDILAWTNDNASDLISGFFLEAADWTKGQIDEAIKDLPGDIEQPQTARQYLRASLPDKPLVSITNRELSKIVFAPKNKSDLPDKPKKIVANIDLYCQCQLAKLTLSDKPQFKMAIGWEHSQHFVFDIRTSLERVAAILLELNELKHHIQQDKTNRIQSPSIAVISPDERNAHLIREQGYYFYHCTQFKPRRSLLKKPSIPKRSNRGQRSC